jgi:hypothetical protein
MVEMAEDLAVAKLSSDCEEAGAVPILANPVPLSVGFAGEVEFLPAFARVPLLTAGNAGAVPLRVPVEDGFGLKVRDVDFLEAVGCCFTGALEVRDEVAVWV